MSPRDHLRRDAWNDCLLFVTCCATSVSFVVSLTSREMEDATKRVAGKVMGRVRKSKRGCYQYYATFFEDDDTDGAQDTSRWHQLALDPSTMQLSDVRFRAFQSLLKSGARAVVVGWAVADPNRTRGSTLLVSELEISSCDLEQWPTLGRLVALYSASVLTREETLRALSSGRDPEHRLDALCELHRRAADAADAAQRGGGDDSAAAAASLALKRELVAWSRALRGVHKERHRSGRSRPTRHSAADLEVPSCPAAHSFSRSPRCVALHLAVFHREGQS